MHMLIGKVEKQNIGKLKVDTFPGRAMRCLLYTSEKMVRKERVLYPST